MFSKLWSKIFGTAAMASLLVFPVMAKIGMPVSITMASADALKRGEPARMLVVIRPAADIPLAHFQVLPSNDWQVVEGSPYWSGSLRKGEDVELRIRVAPLKDDPAPLQGSLRSLGFPDQLSSLDPGRMGGRFPEKIYLVHEGKQGRMATIEPEEIQVDFEPGVELPEPAAATEPRIPGAPAVEAPSVERGKSKSRAASVQVTATGRFVFIDDAGVQRGVRLATVELWDQNPAPSFGDALCRRGTTDGAGNFSLTGTCGDFLNGPDLFVRLVLNNSVVEVKPEGIFTGSYTAQSGVMSNRAAGSSTAFGTITIPNVLAGPFRVHNLITRAERLMRDAGETMPKVNAKFPSEATLYTGVLAEVHVTQDDAFGGEGDVFHEYGHHVLSTKAESPAPNYDNGICDDPTPGHCFFSPENQTIAWTEGWPNFFAQVLHNTHNAADGYGTTRYRFDSNSGLSGFDFPGLQDQTEGFIAAILVDLFDSVEANPAHADTLSLSFNTLWGAVRNFDPSPIDPFHNHPTNIHEYWDALRSVQLANINRISAIYASLGIVKPRPNLEITAIQAAPGVVNDGGSFTVTNRAMNTGNERANNAFTVRFRYLPVQPSRNAPVLVGTRRVAANLIAGGMSAATTTLTVPLGTAAGWYVLEACADSGNAVPESDETDNCTIAGGATEIR